MWCEFFSQIFDFEDKENEDSDPSSMMEWIDLFIKLIVKRSESAHLVEARLISFCAFHYKASKEINEWVRNIVLSDLWYWFLQFLKNKLLS